MVGQEMLLNDKLLTAIIEMEAILNSCPLS